MHTLDWTKTSLAEVSPTLLCMQTGRPATPPLPAHTGGWKNFAGASLAWHVSHMYMYTHTGGTAWPNTHSLGSKHPITESFVCGVSGVRVSCVRWPALLRLLHAFAWGAKWRRLLRCQCTEGLSNEVRVGGDDVLPSWRVHHIRGVAAHTHTHVQTGHIHHWLVTECLTVCSSAVLQLEEGAYPKNVHVVILS